MNNLLSGSFAKFGVGSGRGGGGGAGGVVGDLESGHVQMSSSATTAAGGASLDRFFEDVEGVKDELKDLERLHRSLAEANESGKSLHQASAVKALRARMDSDVATALKKAKLVKLRLESLDRANAANRSVPGCGPGTSTDRTRTSVVAGLRKKLRDTMEEFNAVRERSAADYREAVDRRYFTVTGQRADEGTLDALISTGEAERFVQRAIQEGGLGRGEVMDVVTEIRERHGATKELERNLAELHQVFLDMAVLVEAQGEQLNDIESHVARASSFVRGGTEQLQTARQHQKSSRKWACYGIILLLIIILVIILPIILNARKK